MLNECWIATLSWSRIGLRAPFECDVALHVDTTTSAYRIYEIFQESVEDVSEDQVNVTKELSEAPNQSSEASNTNISEFSPTSKGKPRCISQYFNLLQFYYYIIYLALRLGVEMKP
jgi:type III secretory pathway lipoprotein EscJ